jgi:biopolymer transport protein ExbB/TolQ
VQGEAPSAELPEIRGVARVQRSRQRRPKLPDTSPPTAILAVLAIGATWLVFALGPQLAGAGRLQAIWTMVESCQWVGVIEVFLFLWGLLFVTWKLVLWAVQRRTLAWNVFPEAYAGTTKIRPSDVEACLTHVDGLVRCPERSILLNRVRLALQHLRQAGDVPEVRGTLTGQSAIDANLLDSSYAVLRFLVWVLPIVGFIGTVLGIGMAVGKFADFIPKVSEVEEAMNSLRQGLGDITVGLGTAFNTTLVALVLVTPLMFVNTYLRKLEEKLLAQIDQFSNHDLLGKLDVPKAAVGKPAGAAASAAAAPDGTAARKTAKPASPQVTS